MSAKFFRCACGKIHTIMPLGFRHGVCSCGRLLDTVTGTSQESTS